MRSKAACAASPRTAAVLEDATHVQSRTASKDNSGCDHVSVSLWGSASLSPPETA